MTSDRCEKSHYVSIVEANKGEVYEGDRECASCLRRMAEQHEALAQLFRTRLIKLKVSSAGSVRCRVYDAFCINPSYCDEHDACCAGDMNCVPEKTS